MCGRNPDDRSNKVLKMYEVVRIEKTKVVRPPEVDFFSAEVDLA